MKRAFVLIAVGCGRLHFDPIGTAGSDAAASGDAAACVAAAESCNGVDDDCDGLVDEGCPCMAFSKSFPSFSLSGYTVSDGIGWMASDGNELYRIDPDGTITPLAPDPSMRNDSPGHQPAAWTGSEYVRLDANDRMEFFALDGQLAHVGPTLSANFGQALMHWNGHGFEIGSGPISGFEFTITDAGGVPLVTSTGPADTLLQPPLFVGVRAGTSTILWSDGNASYYATPHPPDAIVRTQIESGLPPVFASAGGSQILYQGTAAYVIDDQGTSPVTLSLGGFGPFDAAWTGNGWDVVATNGLSSNPVILRRFHLDASFAVTSMTDIASIPNTTSIGESYALLATDARRTLLSWNVSVGGGPDTLYLEASCH